VLDANACQIQSETVEKKKQSRSSGNDELDSAMGRDAPSNPDFCNQYFVGLKINKDAHKLYGSYRGASRK
jgi:hypothetical protein